MCADLPCYILPLDLDAIEQLPIVRDATHSSKGHRWMAEVNEPFEEGQDRLAFSKPRDIPASGSVEAGWKIVHGHDARGVAEAHSGLAPR